MLLQEKGQLVSEATSWLVSEARGHTNRAEAVKLETNLEKIAPWKLRTHAQSASFKARECALTGCHVQGLRGLRHNHPTVNLTPLG